MLFVKDLVAQKGQNLFGNSLKIYMPKLKKTKFISNLEYQMMHSSDFYQKVNYNMRSIIRDISVEMFVLYHLKFCYWSTVSQLRVRIN